MISAAALTFLDPQLTQRGVSGPTRIVIEDTPTRAARLPRAPGPAWRVAGGAPPRECWFHGTHRGGFASVARRARPFRWSTVEVVVPAEEVFADCSAALAEYRRRRAARQDAAAVAGGPA